MNDPIISLHIVTWNSMRFLPDLLSSIKEQTFKEINILIIDNASSDGVEDFVKEHYPEIVFIRNARNLGFSAAHNQGIRYAIEHWPKEALQDRFILLTNPDIIFTPTYLEELIASARVHPEVASFGGKLLRAFGENIGDEVFKQTVRSDRLDSVGLNPHRNYTVTDRGAGELDQGQYDEEAFVFGISGALVLFRASSLEDVRYQDEILDHHFFAYKEDVDLAWRLQQAGWDAFYVPRAVAYHYRGMYGPEKSGLWQRLRNHRSKSSLRNFFSTRNHWLMLIKNIHSRHFFLALPWIAFYEGGRLIYVLFFEHSGLRTIKETCSLFPVMLKKRAHVFKKAKRSAKDLRHWFV
ncbi:glycosyltransferase family 2 protein [Candidatus Uhrbacteria bacterium]|nr:glycosyltransferase family 2 protein [Candidatus Uhrbacteria bacterium]